MGRQASLVRYDRDESPGFVKRRGDIAVSGEKNTDYLRRRAAEERERALAATDSPAKLAHRQLAELFEREADEASALIPHLIE
jgi:hypothetical protein